MSRASLSSIPMIRNLMMCYWRSADRALNTIRLMIENNVVDSDENRSGTGILEGGVLDRATIVLSPYFGL